MKSNFIKTHKGKRSTLLYVGKVCVTLMLICQLAIAQSQTTVSGRVVNSANEPLSGVSVNISGTAAATTTDDKGVYKITAPTGNETITFSYLGMKTQEMAISGRTTIDVILEVSGTDLDEVVVVGYGRQSRETLTTAISKVDSKVFENVPYSNAASALQGSVSGVRVQSTSGQPGAAPRIIVRGGTSI